MKIQYCKDKVFYNVFQYEKGQVILLCNKNNLYTLLPSLKKYPTWKNWFLIFENKSDSCTFTIFLIVDKD